MEIRAPDRPLGPPAGLRVLFHLRNDRLLVGFSSRTLPAWAGKFAVNFAVNGSLFGTIPAH